MHIFIKIETRKEFEVKDDKSLEKENKRKISTKEDDQRLSEGSFCYPTINI